MKLRWLIGCAAGIALLMLGARFTAQRSMTAPPDSTHADYSGSAACRDCHTSRHASWERTFHRTMTQVADADSVEGVFDGRELTLEGQTVRVRRDGTRHLIEYLDRPGGSAVRTLPVVRTIGSRRYQQYLVQDPAEPDAALWRAPVFWHIEEKRWMHLNGAFLAHDGMPFDKHLTLWNQNCIFCHNTGAQPQATNLAALETRRQRGEAVDVEHDLRFDSRVAELGIGCEACHGPGAEHVRRQRSWAASLAGDSEDPSIVNPARLTAERANDICAQCHAGRIPSEESAILDWLVTGHPFRPGEDLSRHVRLIGRETPVPGRPATDTLFQRRFWNDGTPRLSAYEAQGLAQSRCASGKLRCIDCHSMHAGDPHGMMLPSKRTSAACARCHSDIVKDAAAHSRNTAGCASTDCYECHMPRMVYGVMDIHRSHRIERPDPLHATAHGKPDACTQCHSDRPAGWAAEALRSHGVAQISHQHGRADRAPADIADFVASLHAGDPVRRAVAARTAGLRATALSPRQRAWLVPHLLITLHDAWPSVRFQAWRSLRALRDELKTAGISDDWAAALSNYDPQAPQPLRRRTADDLMLAWKNSSKRGLAPAPASMLLDADFMPDFASIMKLLQLQAAGAVVDIGE